MGNKTKPWKSKNGSFKYLPLKCDGYIRLLRLRTPRLLSRHIKCEMIQVPLRKAPDYLALSYTWGDPTPRFELECTEESELGKSSGILPLTESLDSYLHHFLAQDKDRSHNFTEYIWIDALCINQGDLKEKIKQVAMMGDIYRNAIQVSIWLGESTEDSDHAIDVLIRINNSSSSRLTGDTGGPNGSYSIIDQFLQEISRPLRSGKLTYISNLMSRAWFRRVWIIQEVVSAVYPIVVCGNRRIHWDAFVAGLRAICTASTSTDIFEIAEPHWGYDNMTVINEIRNCRLNDNHPMDLQSVLLFSRSFNASNARDKVFALLGVVTEDETYSDSRSPSLYPPLPPWLQSNYESPVEFVYLRTAVYLLTSDDYLTMLSVCGIGNPRKLQTLPSWVPEWTTNSFDITLQDNPRITGYNASLQTKPATSFLPPDLLTLCGLVVDEIEHVVEFNIPTGATKLAKTTVQEAAKEEIQAFHTFFEKAEALTTNLTQYPTEKDAKDAFWRTLLTNQDRTGMTPSYMLGEDLVIFRTYLKYRITNANWPGEEMLAAMARQSLPFYLCLGRLGFPRTFFTTKSGYMGMAMGTVLVGDVVSIICGVCVPFVLRGSGGERVGAVAARSLVCESYVHGMMNGECMDNSKIVDIVLR